MTEAHFDREELESQLRAHAAGAQQQAAEQDRKHKQQVRALQLQVQELQGLLLAAAGSQAHHAVPTTRHPFVHSTATAVYYNNPAFPCTKPVRGLIPLGQHGSVGPMTAGRQRQQQQTQQQQHKHQTGDLLARVQQGSSSNRVAAQKAVPWKPPGHPSSIGPLRSTAASTYGSSSSSSSASSASSYKSARSS